MIERHYAKVMTEDAPEVGAASASAHPGRHALDALLPARASPAPRRPGRARPSGRCRSPTVGAPTPQVSETIVKRVEAPRLLEYSWGGNELRWELEPRCFDVLEQLLAGEPIGGIIGAEAMESVERPGERSARP